MSLQGGVTSVPERLPPQDLADDGGPHGLHLAGTGLEDERVLRLPAAEPDLEAQAAVAHVLRHPDLGRLPGEKKQREEERVELQVTVGGGEEPGWGRGGGMNRARVLL